MKKEFSEKIVLEYMQEHLLERPSLSRICKDFGYSRNYFAKLFTGIFGVPYTSFLHSLMMRDAVDRLVQGETPIHEIAEMYGYASSYQFSRAFKREIGLSPRLFLKSDRFVPDIPSRRTVYGQQMFLNYIQTEDAAVYGYPVRAEHGLNTDLLRECAYHMDHEDPHFDMVSSDVKVSFWWSDSPDDLYYVLGSFDYDQGGAADETSSAANAGAGAVSTAAELRKIEIPGSSYAVFSVERTGDDAEDLIIHREMVRYAMLDWVWMNRKKPDRMYYTYEVFDKTYTYLYLPLQADTISPSLITHMRELSIDNWISYIDSRIRDDITVKDIAAHFHYSDTHFRRTFKMYFEMTPQEYITKRRLYFAASEISETKGKDKQKEVAEKYYFHTTDYFNTMFLKEFHIQPDNYRSIRIRAINLAEYYSHQKDSVTVTFSYQEDLTVAGFDPFRRAGDILKPSVTAAGRDEQDDYDIPEIASYWMLHDPDEILGTSLETPRPGAENKAAVWYSDKETTGYEYIIGYIVGDKDEIPPDYITVQIKSGKYAVFESMAASDRNMMADTYRMLMRCSFYGWIKDNRFRVDFSRLTFVRFMNNKYYFYIPINE